jgi:AAA domain
MVGGSREFRFLTPRDLQNLPDPTWLVAGIIPANAVCVLYGEPGPGKSFVALSLALSISSGHQWCGKVTVQGPVIYGAAEGLRGFKLRVPAYELKHGFSAEGITYLDEGFDLRSSDVGSLIRAIETREIRPVLIIIDTLARHMPGADENSAKDMGEAIAGIERLRQGLQVTVLIIHHTRKGGGIERGSSALRGAADVMIECSSSDISQVKLTCDKMKDAEPFKLGPLGLECITLGPTSSSLAVTGSLLEALEAGAERASEKKALEILECQFRSKGARHKDWLAASGLPAKTFDRARKELLKGGAVRQDGPIYHPNRPDGGVSVSPVSP